MSTSANEFLMSGGAASAKFPTIGTTVAGYIVREPEVQQQRDIKTGENKFWKDGKPMQQLQVVLATADRDPANPEDDGERAVYIKANLKKALQDAIRKAGAPGIAVGGYLTVTYSGNGPQTNPAFDPPKVYACTYAAPAPVAANEFLEQPAPAPAQPQYAPPAAQQAPANQWNQPIAQAPAFAQPPTPAPVPVGVNAETAAALAQLTPEMRAALGFA